MTSLEAEYHMREKSLHEINIETVIDQSSITYVTSSCFNLPLQLKTSFASRAYLLNVLLIQIFTTVAGNPKVSLNNIIFQISSPQHYTV